MDWSVESRQLALAEARALDLGEALAPGLFRSSAVHSRSAFVLGGGEILSEGPAGGPLPSPPAGLRELHVVRGPWKQSGHPLDFLAQLGWQARSALRGSSYELYATPSRWYLVRAAADFTPFMAPELRYRNSTSLPSRLARGIVNLVVRPGDVVEDPVCGAGVLLVEAARVGASVRGSDLSKKAVGSARANLAALGLSGELQLADALAPSSQHVDVLLGDLPYGRRLQPIELEPFVRLLPQRARRWALVAATDLSEAFHRAGQPLVLTVPVPKPTFTRFVHLGGELQPGRG